MRRLTFGLMSVAILNLCYCKSVASKNADISSEKSINFQNAGLVTPRLLENRSLVNKNLCKALASGDSGYCGQNDEVCKALTQGVSNYCPSSRVDSACHAIAARRSDLCDEDDRVCKAIASHQASYCRTDDFVCKAVAGRELHSCPTGDHFCDALASRDSHFHCDYLKD